VAAQNVAAVFNRHAKYIKIRFFRRICVESDGWIEVRWWFDACASPPSSGLTA
jgi:hypothetical protein